MAPLGPAALLPPTLASTVVLGPPHIREQLLAPEVLGVAVGIVVVSQTRLCMCPGCCTGKKNQWCPLFQGSKERPWLMEFQKSLEGLVLGNLMLIRESPC